MDESGVAVWRQIERALQQDIETHRLKPGTRLPGEHDLAERFNVNRHTARRALQSLSERGLIRIEKGRGSFVESAMVDYRIHPRTRFSENVARLARAPSGEFVRCVEIQADDAMAEALGIDCGDAVILLETLGIADGKRISLGAHHFAKARFAKIGFHYKRLGSITKSLAKLGVADYTRKTTRISTRLPTPHEARLLRQPAAEPVLIVESVNVDSSGRPIEYGIARMAGGRTQLVVEF
ncbi:MAG: phosphonate metabolism transcriptional regulator PhnF [Rhodospirillales bacterium]|nr:MAG: phosphonate metabolism transcriptional regulator PhnF [Rhodospirillales bacterium]